MPNQFLSLIYRCRFGPRKDWEIAVSIRLPESKLARQLLKDAIRAICDQLRVDLETTVARANRVSA